MTKYKMIFITLLFTFVLTACGENEELTAYQEDMNTFFERAAEYNDKMNAIDRESDTAVIELLGYLDAFAEDIQWMAELTVPEQFSAVESLADEADENMKEAVALFHAAYGGETYDEGSEQAALEYYDRTNIRIQYIITILHGEIPEGEGVIYTEESPLLGGGYLNRKDEDEEAESTDETEDSDQEDSGGDVPEDDFDTDDTVFYEEPSETDGE
ncbi:MAG: hypothetical protein K2I53_11345 [Lachnospiraceae bacterium]|nr:hypothetical protein [Lachnospiraceae bacterium]